ncbi:MAG: SRPBCC family protein [Flavobacteriia bacterium]|nr:SRPBCC family protein [Flavobacteriia bacterium]
MRYSCFITIDKPRARVVEMFQDPDGLKNWMDGFQKMEHISGEKGKVGSKTDFYFKHKNREMLIHETVLEEDLPNSIKFGYQSPAGYNEVETEFTENENGKTLVTTNNYFKFGGAMKIMSFFFKGMFRKQSDTHLKKLKEWVEAS